MSKSQVFKMHPKLVPFFVLLVLCSLCNGCYGLQSLGKGAYLPSIDTLGVDNLPSSLAIFGSDVSGIIVTSKVSGKQETSRFLHNSESLYSELAQRSGISGSYNSIKFTMDQTYKAISRSTKEVTSYFITAYSYNQKFEVERNALAKIALNANFVKALQALPESIRSPEVQSSWTPYAQFMKQWGSHYVSAVYTGSWVQQWSVSESSKSYKQSDFVLRACLKLDAGKGSVDACAGISTSDIQKASNFEMSDTLYVKGGSAATRAAIKNARTRELMDKFMLEGASSNTTVRYKYTPLWDVIRERFSFGGKEWQIANNLEAYYQGYLAFGCSLEKSRSFEMQKFQASRNEFGTSYQCVRACRGCHSDNDCHIGGAGSVCYCYGPTCIETDKNDRPRARTSQAGSYYEGENNSCWYQVGVWCACRRQYYHEDTRCVDDKYVVLWDQTSLKGNMLDKKDKLAIA